MKYFYLVLFAIGFAIGLFANNASAATFWQNGILYGNICRAGIYYIVLPFAPVGTPCYIDFAGTRWHGAISME